jgi:hypothetical protein
MMVEKFAGISGLLWLLRGNATPPALAERAVGSLSAEIFAFPGTIGLMPIECSDTILGASQTLFSVQ